MFELQHAKPPFGRYGDLELLTEVQLLMFKISVITGWKLPDDESYLTVLVDQFVKKIKEDYPHLNNEEVEHAFRKNTQVKDWGKAFNLALIDQVLIPYLEQRREIKEFVERLPQTENLLTLPADWKELCELNYQQFLTGRYNIETWPWQMYDECVKAGYIADDAFEDYLGNAIYHIKSWIPENQYEQDKRSEILQAGKSHQKVIEMAKKLAVKVLYQFAQINNYTKLFEKVKQ